MANVFIEESTMQAIGNAIRSKTGKSALILPSNMPTEIRAISTSTGIDTSSDNPVTASDMAKGKEAFVNGEKIIGVADEGFPRYYTVGEPYYGEGDIGGSLYTRYAINYPVEHYNRSTIVRTGDEWVVSVQADKFGDAAASDVIAGKTFTSVNGLKITGTASSSTNVDTCVVAITDELGRIKTIKYCALTNGKIEIVELSNPVQNDFLDLEVVKNSFLYVELHSGTITMSSPSSGLTTGGTESAFLINENCSIWTNWDV